MKLVVCVPVCPTADLEVVAARANAFTNMTVRRLPFGADSLEVRMMLNNDNRPRTDECAGLDFFHPADHIILAKYLHALEDLDDEDTIIFMDDDVSVATIGRLHAQFPIWEHVLTFPVARLDGVFPLSRRNMDDPVNYLNCPHPGESIFSICRPLWACCVRTARVILEPESLGNAHHVFELPYMISESCRKNGVPIIFSLDIIGTETPWQTNP